MAVETFDVALNYDTSKAMSSLGQFRAAAMQAFTELQAKSSKIDVLRDLKADADKSATALTQLARQASTLRGEMTSLGASGAWAKSLATDVAAASRELKAHERALAANADKMSDLGARGVQLAANVQASYAKVSQLRSALDGLQSGDAAFERIAAALKKAEAEFERANGAVVANKLRMSELARASEETSARMDALRATAARLNEQLATAKSGSARYDELKRQLADVERQFTNASKAAAKQQDQVAALEAELKRAGVDTANLAGAQANLAKSLQATQQAMAVQSARQTLGVVGAEEGAAQIKRLREAYDTLRQSGTASARELTVAHTAMAAKVREVEVAMQGGAEASSLLNLRFMAQAASAGLIARSLGAAAKSAIDFEQGMARISSIANLNRVQLDEMGRAILDVTQKVGIDLPTALRATYEIISSGIPTGNAIEVLDKSAKAAIAGVTDINTAARIGVATINAYGLQVGQLGHVYDILFQTVKDGVITFPELADKLGLVLPAAKNAGLSLEEVSASIVVLTRAGFTAPRAMVALEGAIKQLAAPTDEASKAMLELGIRYNGFIGTVEQIAKKNIGPEMMRRLVPDVEGQRAIATMAQNMGLLKGQVDEAAASTGAAADSYAKLANTGAQNIEKFKASVEGLRIAAGQDLSQALGVVLPPLTDLVNSMAEGERRFGTMTAVLGMFFPPLVQVSRAAQDAAALADVLGPALSRAGVAAGTAKLPVGGLSDGYLALKKATEEAVASTVKSATDLGGVLGPSIAAVEQKLATLNTAIVSNVGQLDQLQQRIQTTAAGLQTVLGSQLTEIGANLERSVALTAEALSKREISETESVQRVAKLTADAESARVAAIKQYADSAVRAFDAEASVRLALVAKANGDVRQAEIELNTKRIGLLDELKAKYGAVATEAINQAKIAAAGVAQKEDELRQAREKVAQQQREIAVANGTAVQQYYARQAEAERALLLAQQAGAQGRLDLQKQYADQALGIAKSLEQATSDNEGRFVSAERAKANAASITARAGQQIEASLNAQIEAQKKSGDSATQSATVAVDALKGVDAKMTEVRTKQADAIALRVQADSKQAGEEIAALQKLLSERELVQKVKVNIDAAKDAIQDLVDAIEKKKPQLEVVAKLDQLKRSITEAEKTMPTLGITPDTSKVAAALGKVADGVTALGQKKIELQSNLDEISKKINDLNGFTTRSTHVIELRYEDTRGAPATPPAGFARGGLVSVDGPRAAAAASRLGALQYFAGGGVVRPRGFAGMVPGVGNTDSVPALLASGSFVLRKAATQALMGGIWSRGVAGAAGGAGGLDGLIEAVNAAPSLARSALLGAMFEAALGVQDANIRTLRARAPVGLVEQGAEAVSRAQAAPQIETARDAYERARASNNATSADEATRKAVELAQRITQFSMELALTDRDKPNLKHADGGAIAGGAGAPAAVPALLTPGELVFSPDEVRRIGLSRLEAFNARRRQTMADNVRAFADGGFVAPTLSERAGPAVASIASALSGVTAGSVSNDYSTTIGPASVTINAPSGVNERQLARIVVDELDRVRRLRGGGGR